MTAEVRLMTEAVIASYHACLDTVASEHLYLASPTAPPLEESRVWVTSHIQQGHPFFVAVAGSHVVGWCDITPQHGE